MRKCSYSTLPSFHRTPRKPSRHALYLSSIAFLITASTPVYYYHSRRPISPGYPPYQNDGHRLKPHAHLSANTGSSTSRSQYHDLYITIHVTHSSLTNPHQPASTSPTPQCPPPPSPLPPPPAPSSSSPSPPPSSSASTSSHSLHPRNSSASTPSPPAGTSSTPPKQPQSPSATDSGFIFPFPTPSLRRS